MSVILKIKSISKTYPNISTAKHRIRSLLSLLFKNKINNGSTVIKNISLSVKKGESLAIIGKNGAGKSTLLKIISGVIRPTYGEVRAFGKIGALLELGSGFHPEYSGRENLKMSAALAKTERNNINNAVEQMIEFADIGEYIDQPVKNYSSGMVVRLGFSVITVTQPDILITDEVLAVGDTEFQRKCISWIDNYLANGGTLLLVSHSIYHVQKLCKHALWLEKGVVKKYGDSFTVSQEYQSYHEKKISKNKQVNNDKDITNYHIESLKLMNRDMNEITYLNTFDDLIVEIVIYSPDDRAPGLALGIVRKDTPVYGTISDNHNAKPNKISENRYRYRVKYKSIKLLPADYELRAHAMDPECMRAIDEMKKNIRIQADTTNMGLVVLDTEWN